MQGAYELAYALGHQGTLGNLGLLGCRVSWVHLSPESWTAESRVRVRGAPALHVTGAKSASLPCEPITMNDPSVVIYPTVDTIALARPVL